MSRLAVWSLYGLLVVIWSSTWVAIKVGLEDTPPLLGAGVRFVLAGAGLLVIARVRGRTLRTDWVLATVLGVVPFAASYGLIYWGEQYVPSGLAAVLFGVLPIYVAVIASVALRDEPLRARLLAGVALALAGLVVAFGESVALGDARYAVAALLLAVSAAAEDWGDAAWTGQALGSIGYLAAIGTALAFVTLMRLLLELPAVTISFIALLLPFGALVFGALVYDEPITLAELGGAALVAAGIFVAQWPGRAAVRRAVMSRAPG
jgi:drug/metabolite transporter (DMT)-like permease